MTLDVKTDYMSSPQAAKILRITSVGVAQLARQGKIPAVKIANRWLIPRAFLKDFAQTYEGKRGRPRKSRRLAMDYPIVQAAPQPATADPAATLDVSLPRQEASGILPINPGVADLEETSAVSGAQGGPLPVDAIGPGEAQDSGPAVGAVSAYGAGADQGKAGPVAEPQAGEPAPGDLVPASAEVPVEPDSSALVGVTAVAGQTEETSPATPPPSGVEVNQARTEPEAPDTGQEGDGTFAVSAEVFHLDRNYDFEVYQKGRITEQARLIVARLKPKIPSLPQFSFRWDYRYEHLNIDIHGVEPSVKEWWTMGENGYTGHLPRRLPGPQRTFEAIIWLPVTFVFRGRLTLALQSSPEDAEGPPSVAATTGGFRRLWNRWSGGPRS